ncbi:GNAT family N-acetyltransferase [Shivajiella indica]|uniref:GNAT family N-acetyltransferase n=1 Tax=Shivajiella indica TaxID=872115 RepID=A0ABW5BAE9_9BACT
MVLHHEQRETKGQFKFIDGEEIAGFMTYTMAGTEKLIIEHTEVNSKYKGLGIGKKLVVAGVEFARKNNLKILPLCPFARGVFARNKDLRDVHV